MKKKSTKSSIHISYQLVYAGTTKIIFTLPHKKIEINFTYLSNPLPKLLNAGAAINAAKPQFHEIVFTDEPGCHKLQLIITSKNKIQLSIYYHHCGFAIEKFRPLKKVKTGFNGKTVPLPISSFKHIASFQCSTKEFSAALLSAMQQMLTTHTKAAYKQNWGYSFPSKQYSTFASTLLS